MVDSHELKLREVRSHFSSEFSPRQGLRRCLEIFVAHTALVKRLLYALTTDGEKQWGEITSG